MELENPGVAHPAGTVGTALITAERQRQIGEEGYTLEHDRLHTEAELRLAALAYQTGVESYWPWPEGFKPTGRVVDSPLTDEDRARGAIYAVEWMPSDQDLVKAGALLAAALDRRQP